MDVCRNTMLVAICSLFTCNALAQYRVQLTAYDRAVAFDYFEKLGLQDIDFAKDQNDIFRYYFPIPKNLEVAEQQLALAKVKGFKYARIINLEEQKKLCSNQCGPAALPFPDSRKYEQMIQFQFNGYRLTEYAREELDMVTSILNSQSDFSVRLMGHTDAIGSAQYNISLASTRALESKNYLLKKGIDPQRIKIKVFGESQPVALNRDANGKDLPEGRKYNRRVEMQIIDERDQSIFRWKKPVVIPFHLRANPKTILELSRPDPKTE